MDPHHQSRGQQAVAASPARTEHKYFDLPDGWIRLLLLAPDEDRDAEVRCRLIDYRLSDTEMGAHPYEALSYVWGSSADRQILMVGDKGSLRITRNLNAALRRLRHGCLERILWVDSVCINQNNIAERGQQIQLMTKIYASATRVVVWIEEAVDPHADDRGSGSPVTTNSGQGLEQLRLAAGGPPSDGGLVGADNDHYRDNGSDKGGQEQDYGEAIWSLLGRPWFRRIWEVAAARHVVMVSHSTEIDGQAFCLGLEAMFGSLLKPARRIASEDDPFDTRGLGSPSAHPNMAIVHMAWTTASLIKGAAFRPRRAVAAGRRGGGFSLGISPLAELLDLYHDRDATDRRDKLFGLLGMCSDKDIPASLLSDYAVGWRDLFGRLACHIVGNTASVMTWEKREVAVARVKGCILGLVNGTRSSASRSDEADAGDSWLKVNVANRRRRRWLRRPPVVWKTVHLAAPFARHEDLVCLLDGIEGPVVIRPRRDYWVVVAVGTRLGSDDDAVVVARTRARGPHRDFLLVWDWEQQLDSRDGDRERHHYDDFGLNKGHAEAGPPLLALPDQAGRFLDLASVLADVDRQPDAFERFLEMMDHVTRAPPSSEGLRRVLAAAYGLASRCRGLQGHNIQIMANILGRRGRFRRPDERALLLAIESGRGAVELLTRLHGARVEVTTTALEAAVDKQDAELVAHLIDHVGSSAPGSKVVTGSASLEVAWDDDSSGGEALFDLLVGRPEVAVQVTPEFLEELAASDQREEIEMLLQNFGGGVSATMRITESVMVAAAARSDNLDTIRFLADRFSPRYERVRGPVGHPRPEMGEALLKAAAGNENQSGDAIMSYLLQHANRLGIRWTGDVVQVMAARRGAGLMRRVLDRYAGNIDIDTRVLETAAGRPWHSRKLTELLLQRCGTNVEGLDLMRLLLGREHRAPVTRAVAEAAARNEWQRSWILRCPPGKSSPISNGHELIFLLFRHQPDIEVAEEVVLAAARNKVTGVQVMDVLLENGGAGYVTEQVIAVAAGNENVGPGLIQLFLKYGIGVAATEKVTRAAAANTGSGHLVIERLLSHGIEVEITEQVVLAAALNYTTYAFQIMDILLEDGGWRHVTEQVIAVAAGNRNLGLKLIQLFLEYGIGIVATEKVVRAAVANRHYSHDIIQLFLDHGIKVKVTEEAVSTAAGNQYRGHDILCLFIKKAGGVFAISKRAYEEASANSTCSEMVLALFDEWSVGVDDVWPDSDLALEGESGEGLGSDHDLDSDSDSDSDPEYVVRRWRYRSRIIGRGQ
ncbi:hypothetical protein MFIFM68171_03804 [Madurella fahalii]|uniref:Heterokaryon incompatibility domain-containing protein n=1 Tax=Madurella fahalii TaxID=1157608 RepID=A0ABQ0G752_9PEZI